MSGSTPDRRIVRLPLGLLGMLVLVAGVELFIMGKRGDLVSPLYEDWRISALSAQIHAPKCKILCFGDSLVKYGVLSKVIEARTGLSTYNLATSGGTMPASYFLLKRAIDSGSKPKAVIADLSALMLKENSEPELLNYPELATFGDCLDLAMTSRNTSYFGSLALSKLLPSYCWRFQIRTSTKAALEGRSVSELPALIWSRAHWKLERGSNPTGANRVYHPQEDMLMEWLCPQDWTCSPKTLAYVEKFLCLAESHKITVYWLIPPMAPEVHARRNLRGTDVAYTKFVQSVAAKHQNVVILDARSSGYDNTVHSDYLHLNFRGAVVLSADIASVLTQPKALQSADGKAWVGLPAFAGRTGFEPPSVIARSPAPTSR